MPFLVFLFSLSLETIISFNASIEKDWHLYAVYVPNPNEGPLPTVFKYKPSNNYALKDSIVQEFPITYFDDDFGVEVSYYKNTALFKQKINILKNTMFRIEGSISYMCCNAQTCIPLEKQFTITANQD